MFGLLTWFVTALSLTGTALNVRKNPLCFWLWAFGNTAWLAYDLDNGLYSRSLLDAVQLAFAVWGILAWRKRETKP